MGVETKKERKEGERSSKRKGTRARARKGHDSPGTRLHPGSSKRTGAPGLRGAPPGAEGEEATGGGDVPLLAKPQPSARVGRGCSALAGSVAATTAAGLGGRRRLRGPRRAQRAGFHAPTPGGGSSGVTAARRPRGLPEAGRVLQTLFEIHRHLHPASDSPRRRRWKSRESRGSGCAGDPDSYGGRTAATSAARSCGGRLARWS